MDVIVERETRNAVGWLIASLMVDGYRFTVTLGYGTVGNAPITRGSWYRRDDTAPTAHVIIDKHGKQAPRSTYTIIGSVILNLDHSIKPGVFTYPQPHAVAREDWRLYGSNQYGKPKMMSERQFEDFRPVVTAVFRWCAEQTDRVPPKVDSALIQQVESSRHMAERYLAQYETQQNVWLAKLDELGEAVDRVREWFIARNQPPPEFTYQPNTAPITTP